MCFLEYIELLHEVLEFVNDTPAFISLGGILNKKKNIQTTLHGSFLLFITIGYMLFRERLFLSVLLLSN